MKTAERVRKSIVTRIVNELRQIGHDEASYGTMHPEDAASLEAYNEKRVNLIKDNLYRLIAGKETP